MISHKTANAAKLWMARWGEEREVVFDDLYIDLVLLEFKGVLLTDEDIYTINNFLR